MLGFGPISSLPLGAVPDPTALADDSLLGFGPVSGGPISTASGAFVPAPTPAPPPTPGVDWVYRPRHAERQPLRLHLRLRLPRLVLRGRLAVLPLPAVVVPAPTAALAPPARAMRLAPAAAPAESRRRRVVLSLLLLGLQPDEVRQLLRLEEEHHA